MTKKTVALICLVLAISASGHAQHWKPVSGKILTPWAERVHPEKPHPEYPRPQLERSGNWQNLNGLWKYTIAPKDQTSIPSTWEGAILVPFAVESALSGVGKRVSKDEALWYDREIAIGKNVRNGNVLLHFGAVDWQCDVYVNGRHIGRHEGGYDPFSMDITAALEKGERQRISVRVWDPANDGPQPLGKQTKNPHSIWYTSVTGIWQTVWLEGVPQTHIVRTKHTPDVDRSLLHFQAQIAAAQPGDQLVVEAYDGQSKIAESTANVGSDIFLSLPKAELWSPDRPKLYDLRIKILRKGKAVDEAKSYFAMRKISIAKDAQGIQRMYLNDRFVFQNGPLDQGWWPDGLYTAPTDEALLFDIAKTKEMGFNMIRKHVKVEPARWYRHCDSLGVLVWQDMPSGDLGGNHWDMQPGKISPFRHDKIRTAESEAIFRKEWQAIVEAFHNFPSIVVWVPFNEAWGQFKSREIVDWSIRLDPSRLVNGASGGNFDAPGHILDVHNYPSPVMPDPKLFGGEYVLVLGEYGGLGLPLEGHTWQEKDNWGYQSFKNRDELQKRYAELVDEVARLIPLGLSACVYTQTTDVEVETNGLMTYDRKVVKIPESELKQIHEKLYDPNIVK